MGNFHTVSGLAAACGFTGSTKACIILNGKLDDSDQDIQVGALALKYSGGRVNPLVATIARARPRRARFLCVLWVVMDQRRFKKIN